MATFPFLQEQNRLFEISCKGNKNFYLTLCHEIFNVYEEN